MSHYVENFNILVISNEFDIINRTSIFFDAEHFSFTLAKDPLSGLRLVMEKNFDLIIINNCFDRFFLEILIKKIRFFDAFAYILIASDDVFLQDSLEVFRLFDVQAYFNLNDDFHKLVVLINLILFSVFEFNRVNLQLDNFSDDFKSPYLSTVQILRNIAEYKDSYTIGHSFRVSKFSVLIGRALGLSRSKLQLLKVGSIFHDVGKISTPDSILLKSGRLSDIEFLQIKMHPAIGAHILFPTSLYSKVVPIVKFHHERFDGLGYPTGLAGEEIPLLARIVSVADTFDAMTSARTYRKALPLDVVVSEFEKNKGKQFDPVITDVFLDILRNDFGKISRIQKRYK